MKLFQVLLILAGIIALSGIYVVDPLGSASNSMTASIPAGNYYYRIELSVLKGGHLSGTFNEIAGNSVSFYLFNEPDFQAYAHAGTTTSLYATSGPNGSFSTAISSPGTYYLVLAHSTSGSNTVQNIQISYTIDGLNLEMLLIGTTLILAGVVLTVVGIRMRRRTIKPRSHTDVILFKNPATM